MTSSDIAFASIAQLSALLRQRVLSSVELTTACLRRLEKLGTRLNAVVSLVPERALREAKQADRELAAGHDRGPLHGIPYGAKDLLAAKGARTTWGAAPYREQVLDYDATAVKRLSAAGAVLVAKLAMIELAGGMGYNQANASFTGPCKTPWHEGFWSGGSSSGPGAAVAAGLVPFAIGSETDGSIMNPASFCGVTGLRPTYGRVSRHGAMALSWSMDKLGPLCRSAADARIVYEAIAGYDDNDPTSLRNPSLVAAATPERWRIATLKGATAKVQPEVRTNFEKSLRALQHMATFTQIELPDLPYDAAVGAIIAAEGAAAFRDIIQDGRVMTLSDPDGQRGGYSSLVTYAADYVDAMRSRRKMRAAFNAIFKRVDAIAAPTYSTVAFPIGVPFDKAYPGTNDLSTITAANLTGIPAVAVPNGFGIHGLPTSTMFVSSALREDVVLQIAQQYQERTDWHARRPPTA